MKKRTFFFLAALLTVFSQGTAEGFLDRWSFRLSPGGVMPIGGRFNDVTRLRNTVNFGAGLAGGLRYRVSDYFYVGADYGLTWLSAKTEYRPLDYKGTAARPQRHEADRGTRRSS